MSVGDTTKISNFIPFYTMHSFNMYLLSPRKFYWLQGYEDEHERFPYCLEFT